MPLLSAVKRAPGGRSPDLPPEDWGLVDDGAASSAFFADAFDFRAFVYLLGMRLGPKRVTRDIRIIHDHLLESGRAAWLDEGDPPPDPPPLEDVSRAVERVRALFAERLGGRRAVS
jgi:hypothetical protein